jgi:transcriptional regulator with XRE-family HTH domain
MTLCETQQQTELPPLEHRVGQHIRLIRKSRGMRLEDLAIKCGTTPQTIQRFEAATMTLSVRWLGIVCAALDIEPGELFDGRFDHQKAHLELREDARVLLARCENFMARLNAFLEESDG